MDKTPSVVERWRLHVGSKTLNFGVRFLHECWSESPSSVVLFDSIHRLYGCEKCGRYHICQPKERGLHSPMYGYECIPLENEDGDVVCALSGRRIGAQDRIIGNFNDEKEDRDDGIMYGTSHAYLMELRARSSKKFNTSVTKHTFGQSVAKKIENALRPSSRYYSLTRMPSVPGHARKLTAKPKERKRKRSAPAVAEESPRQLKRPKFVPYFINTDCRSDATRYITEHENRAYWTDHFSPTLRNFEHMNLSPTLTFKTLTPKHTPNSLLDSNGDIRPPPFPTIEKIALDQRAVRSTVSAIVRTLIHIASNHETPDIQRLAAYPMHEAVDYYSQRVITLILVLDQLKRNRKISLADRTKALDPRKISAAFLCEGLCRSFSIQDAYGFNCLVWNSDPWLHRLEEAGCFSTIVVKQSTGGKRGGRANSRKPRARHGGYAKRNRRREGAAATSKSTTQKMAENVVFLQRNITQWGNELNNTLYQSKLSAGTLRQLLLDSKSGVT